MLYIIVAAIALIADILTKLLVVKNLMPIGSVTVIKNILDFTYVENSGIAFGMFSGKRLIFIVTSLVILAFVLGIIFKIPKEQRSVFLKLGSALIAGGAAGNLIDRIFRGYVVDFIQVKFIDFPVFNIADIAVCVGAAMLIIHFLFLDGRKPETLEEEDNE